MTPDEFLKRAAESNRAQHVELFKNYGFLLQTMTPEELAVEIGKQFHSTAQAAILTVLAYRLYALEHGEDPDQ